MDLLSSLREYFTKLDEAQTHLNKHCRNIQIALHALHKRRHMEEVHLQEVEEEDESRALSDIQMDEIDILIKKAEKVLVDDFSLKDTKKKSKPAGGGSTNKLNIITPTQTQSSKVKNITAKGSQLSQKTINRNIPKSKRAGFTDKKDVANENRITEEKVGNTKSIQMISKTNKIDKKKSMSFPLLYDAMFKEEYCNARKLKRNLLKLQNEQSLVKQNNDSISEFMASIKSENNNRKVDSILDINKITQLVNSGFTNEEISEILVNVDAIKRVGYNVIHKYTKYNPLGHCMDMASSNNFYDFDTLSTKELKDFNKLMQVKYSITFQQQLKRLMENRILIDGDVGDPKILHYRQLYLLLLNSNSFPSLVKNR